jgi:hypothetical protein
MLQEEIWMGWRYGRYLKNIAQAIRQTGIG